MGKRFEDVFIKLNFINLFGCYKAQLYELIWELHAKKYKLDEKFLTFGMDKLVENRELRNGKINLFTLIIHWIPLYIIENSKLQVTWVLNLNIGYQFIIILSFSTTILKILLSLKYDLVISQVIYLKKKKEIFLDLLNLWLYFLYFVGVTLQKKKKNNILS